MNINWLFPKIARAQVRAFTGPPKHFSLEPPLCQCGIYFSASAIVVYTLRHLHHGASFLLKLLCYLYFTGDARNFSCLYIQKHLMLE